MKTALNGHTTPLILSAKNVEVKFNLRGKTLTAVRGASLDLYKGETLAIVGESGSGKTTIANLLSGALKPDEGEIELEGRSVFSTARSINLAPEARGIGFVFQTARLLPHLSVEENIRFPQTAGRRRPRVDFAEVVEILGLERLLHRHPGSLSGGEGQRVALARALMGTESLLILDEPLSSLDPERRSLLMGFIERAAQTLDVPILYITHSEEEMRRLARRAFLLQSGRLREMDLRTAASHN